MERGRKRGRDDAGDRCCSLHTLPWCFHAGMRTEEAPDAFTPIPVGGFQYRPRRAKMHGRCIIGWAGLPSTRAWRFDCSAWWNYRAWGCER